MNVLVIGASNNPERYSYKAIQQLITQKHSVFPMHPTLEKIQELPVINSLKEFCEPIHTVTLYVGKTKSDQMITDILALKPQRIIFNPGAENLLLMQQAQEIGIETLEACTLVLLHTQQF